LINLFKKSKSKQKHTSGIIAKKPDPDFIPYVCHYNSNTILTKNGELVKIIRITGFSDESMMSQVSSLRDNIRSSIVNHIPDNKFAFWFHTIRRKKNINPEGEFDEFFPKQLDKSWKEQNKWSEQYVNELYITIISEGLDSSIANFQSLMRSFSQKVTANLHQNYLEQSHKVLAKIVNNILADIEEYGAELLGIKEFDGVLYSQPMNFFGKIVNLFEERYKLSLNDMSYELVSHKIAFGDREIEVIGNETKQFGAMLSIKEYREVSTESLDYVLQLPFEMIVTQSFDFTSSHKEMEPYEYQNYILQVSGDEAFRSLIGVDKFVAHNDKWHLSDNMEEEKKAEIAQQENEKLTSTNFGKLQTTFMIIANSPEDLEADVKSAMHKFNLIGFAVVREDVFSEHCFWAQLPGNFQFLRRQKIIHSSKIAGFAALHSFPAGSIAKNHWGPAVTVLPTILNTPYFFNFHEKDLGHLIVVGSHNSGKTSLINFLISQSRRFKSKIFYFDINKKSECFIKAINGNYYNISYDIKKKNCLSLNPFSLEKNQDSQEFLISWFKSLVTFSRYPIPKEELDFVKDIVNEMFNANVTNFTQAIDFFNNQNTPTIYQKLQVWNKGRLSHIFGAENEESWEKSDIVAFDFTDVIQQKPIVIPIFNYLIYKIEENLRGNPAIMVLSEAWNLINNPIFAPQILEFLARMRSRNCVVIFECGNITEASESEIIFDIRKNVAAEIYTPNRNPEEYYSSVFGLNEEELEMVRTMDLEAGHFMLRTQGDDIIASFNLEKKFSKAKKILSSDEISRIILQEVESLSANENGKVNPEVWIPQFYDVIAQMEKEQEQERIKLSKEEVAKEKLYKASLE